MLLNNPINTSSLGNVMDHLFLIHCSPYQDNSAKETLDLVLATQPFLATILRLCLSMTAFFNSSTTNKHAANKKNVGKAIQAFALYDIDQLFVDEQSLAQRGLTTNDLSTEASTLNTTKLQQLIKQAKKVSNFT